MRDTKRPPLFHAWNVVDVRTGKGATACGIIIERFETNRAIDVFRSSGNLCRIAMEFSA